MRRERASNIGPRGAEAIRDRQRRRLYLDMPTPLSGKLPKDYDKLPVPQPQATAVRKRDPKMLAIVDPGRWFGRGCEYCVAVCPVPDCMTLTRDPQAPD